MRDGVLQIIPAARGAGVGDRDRQRERRKGTGEEGREEWSGGGVVLAMQEGIDLRSNHTQSFLKSCGDGLRVNMYVYVYAYVYVHVCLYVYEHVYVHV